MAEGMLGGILETEDEKLAVEATQALAGTDVLDRRQWVNCDRYWLGHARASK